LDGIEGGSLVNSADKMNNEIADHIGEPIALLDYIASSELDVESVISFVKQLSSQSFVPLIGGETAEMPGTFQSTGVETVAALFSVQEGGGGISLKSLEEEHLLVFSMDGVGTKSRIAHETKNYSGLLLDIAHHSFNDILCMGAHPLGLVFYLGCHSKSDLCLDSLFSPDLSFPVLNTLVKEKPSLYCPGEFDLCAAIVGVVNNNELLPKKGIKKGDILLGLSSSGLHTNGYSLVRKVFETVSWDTYFSEFNKSIGEVLLEPHRDYYSLLCNRLSHLKGLAHITGGGILENLSRIIPDGLMGIVDLDSWEIPSIFKIIQKEGNIPLTDLKKKGMFETFNMGIGMVLVVSPDEVSHFPEALPIGVIEGGNDA